MQIVERRTSILSSPEENSRLKFSSPSGGEENSRLKFSSSSLYCRCSDMKYSRKGGELQLTHPNVNSEVRLPPRWYWGWNCIQCTLQTSSPPPHKLGSRELVCKVHLVQFKLKYTQVHVRVHLSLQAGIGELEHELRCTWSQVCEVLPLFRRSSSIVLMWFQKGCGLHVLYQVKTTTRKTAH